MSFIRHQWIRIKSAIHLTIWRWKKCLQPNNFLSNCDLWPCVIYHKSPFAVYAVEPVKNYQLNDKEPSGTPTTYQSTITTYIQHMARFRESLMNGTIFHRLCGFWKCLWALKRRFVGSFFSLKMPRHQTRFRLIKLHNNVTHNRSGCIVFRWKIRERKKHKQKKKQQQQKQQTTNSFWCRWVKRREWLEDRKAKVLWF